MAWYQQLTPEDDRPPRPNEDPGEAAPEIAGFLTVLIVLNVIGALAALFVALSDEDAEAGIWLASCASAVIGLWISRTIILLLWRIARALEKKRS